MNSQILERNRLLEANIKNKSHYSIQCLQDIDYPCWVSYDMYDPLKQAMKTISEAKEYAIWYKDHYLTDKYKYYIIEHDNTTGMSACIIQIKNKGYGLEFTDLRKESN